MAAETTMTLEEKQTQLNATAEGLGVKRRAQTQNPKK
jgi:hypothetical protein